MSQKHENTHLHKPKVINMSSNQMRPNIKWLLNTTIGPLFAFDETKWNARKKNANLLKNNNKNNNQNDRNTERREMKKRNDFSTFNKVINNKWIMWYASFSVWEQMKRCRKCRNRTVFLKWEMKGEKTRASRWYTTTTNEIRWRLCCVCSGFYFLLKNIFHSIFQL